MLVTRGDELEERVPCTARPKVQPWEPEELGVFLNYSVRDRLGPMFELVALTGLRRGEICGLRWEDVDFIRSSLAVRQQVVQLDDQTQECPQCAEPHAGIRFGAPKQTPVREDVSTLAGVLSLCSRCNG